MHKNKILVAGFALCLLAGCVSPSATLVDSQGTEVRCQATGFGVISGTMANNRYEACVSEAQMRGFKFKEQR